MPLSTDEQPAYLRGRFVLGAVVLTVGAILVMHWAGASGDVVVTRNGNAKDSERAAPVPVGESDAGSSRDCPAPAAGVDPDAAQAVLLFMTAASGGQLDDLPMAPQVRAAVDARAPAPAVSRMTRIRGFASQSARASTCVESVWQEGDRNLSSLDLVIAERSGADWKVTGWLRGTPVEVSETDVAQVAFYDSPYDCSNPDREASVQVRRGTPSERLLAAMEELTSGTSGRAANAASRVPADVQVVSAEVDSGARTARVQLTPTSEKITSCAGRAAVDQVRRTASNVVAGSIPGTDASGSEQEPDVNVEVVVNGKAVKSLRP